MSVAETRAAVGTEPGVSVRLAAVFLPAALPRDGRIAFWDPEGDAPLPGPDTDSRSYGGTARAYDGIGARADVAGRRSPAAARTGPAGPRRTPRHGLLGRRRAARPAPRRARPTAARPHARRIRRVARRPP